eukprot:TRINITY_DN49317_c0_g1_i1.p1 TRINITY_DN49317_c0_g1~~TRINITY_DN49317_c0_g1_i1.p1  ORF type:complete len:396 (+),score=79.86 TRINITY_DN49317_c0_g1_i1:67-1254(+)
MADVAGGETSTEAVVMSRARGCMLGLMIGDALGAAVEGFPTGEIRRLAQATWGSNLIEGYIPAVHMGTFVSAGEPATYRPAKEIRDVNFVPTGPATNEPVRLQCARNAMYTDDTNACLALASSLAACGRADAEHAARSYAIFFRDNEAFRGCPPTAKAVMKATLEGASVNAVGLPPYFPFEGGSFANGGGMRISPVGIAYRNADAPTLRRAVEDAIMSSHRHPEAVDFATVQAAAVAHAVRADTLAEFDVASVLADLASRCETEALRGAITATAMALDGFQEGDDEFATVSQVVARESRRGSGMGFQIASVHMAPCVLWAAFRYISDPRRAIQAAIDLGGDTDTTASMVGAIVGALHGEGTWCEAWASDLENGPWGRDFALGLAESLARLDVRGN